MNIWKKRFMLIIGLLFLLIFFYYIKIPCLFHELTGYLCPGCGMTRSMISYLNLDIIGALKYNLLSVILLYFIIRFYIYGNLNLKRNSSIFLVIVTIIYTIIRNM